MSKMPKITSNYTELLFWENQNLSEFEAIIDEIKDNGIILDKTAFYPESGGQFSDIGQLILVEDKNCELQIKFVEKLNGQVIHHVSGKIPVSFKTGQKVIGKIDWERRKKLMRAHTSQHVVSAILEDQFNIKTMKAVIDEEAVAIYLDRNPSETELKNALIISNKLIMKGRKVESRIYEKDTFPEKIKPKLRGELEKVEQDKVRVIVIEDLDYSLCGGTHCQNIQEIGILFLEDIKGDVINYSFGETALESIASMSQGIINISKSLAAKPNEVVHRIPKMIHELKDLKESNNQLNKILLKQLMNTVKENPKRLGMINILKENFHFAEKKFVLQELGVLTENQVAVFIVNGPIIVIVSSAKTLPANEIVKSFCEQTDNKGGGSPTVAQTSTSNPEKDLEKILEIIEKLIK